MAAGTPAQFWDKSERQLYVRRHAKWLGDLDIGADRLRNPLQNNPRPLRPLLRLEQLRHPLLPQVRQMVDELAGGCEAVPSLHSPHLLLRKDVPLALARSDRDAHLARLEARKLRAQRLKRRLEGRRIALKLSDSVR